MTSLRPLAWQPDSAPHPWTRGVRRLAAAGLRGASITLAHLSRRVSVPSAMEAASRAAPGHLEFYADAGAPEGALYLDGELVGYLPGVTRL